jgi:branched-chain amino acid transport system permease protein
MIFGFAYLLIISQYYGDYITTRLKPSLKVIIFVLSAGYAALAGCLYAHFVTFISPSSFDFIFSIKLVTMVVIGGMASIWGSLLGATVLTILPEVLTVFQDYDIVVYGLILIVVMIFLPQGLTRGILDCLEKVRYERTIGVERNK